MSIEDQHTLSKWLEENDNNREVLAKVETFWKVDLRQNKYAKERVWEKLNDEMAFEEPIENKGNSEKMIVNFSKIAAVLVIGFFIGVLLYQNNYYKNQEIAQPINYLERISLNGQKINIQLPDGSKVKLNAGSKLIAPDQFIGDYREVKLEGEAFFEVIEDKDHPFIITTTDLEVRVLGTAFNVSAYPDEEKITVAVDRGKVSVSSIRDRESGFIIEENEMATRHISSNGLIKTSFDRKEILSWKDKILYFENASFDQVIRTLQRWYGVEFEILTEIDSKKDFTGEYQDKSLDSVMKGIAFIYDFDFYINNNKVIIK